MDYNSRENEGRRGGYMCGNYYCMVHVIRSGDTLYKLSREYGIKVSAIMMANPFADVYNLRIGDELCIPRVGRPTEVPMPADSMTGSSYDEDERVINVELPQNLEGEEGCDV